MNDLVLNVAALEEGKQPLEADLSREFLDGVLRAPPATEFHADGASRLRGTVTKLHPHEVLVEVRFTVPLSGQCKRCLAPLHLEEQVDLVRTWVPPKQSHAPAEHRGEDSEGSFDPALADEEEYTGKEIDLSPAIREQVLLQIPSSPLCREDCKGLCPKCGKDLNAGDCGCDRAVMDPRWAALKGIQLEKKKEK